MGVDRYADVFVKLKPTKTYTRTWTWTKTWTKTGTWTRTDTRTGTWTWIKTRM